MKTKKLLSVLLATVLLFQVMLFAFSANDRSGEIENNKIVVLTNIYPEDSIILLKSLGYNNVTQANERVWVYFITLDIRSVAAVSEAITKLKENKNIVYAGPVHLTAPYDYLGSFPLFTVDSLLVQPADTNTFNPETDFAQFAIKEYNYIKAANAYSVTLEHPSEENVILTCEKMAKSKLFAYCEFNILLSFEGPEVEMPYTYEIADAVKAFMFVAGKAELDQKQAYAYDYDKDGTVSLTDCIKIFRVVSKY